MSSTPYRAIGIGCLVICVISAFVAWERYQNNAAQVAAANQMMQSSPLGGMMQQMTGGAELEPGMPTISKYALAVALLSGVGGVVALAMGAGSGGRSSKSPRSTPEQLPLGTATGPPPTEPTVDRETNP